jgi:hypothetical protein
MLVKCQSSNVIGKVMNNCMQQMLYAFLEFVTEIFAA